MIELIQIIWNFFMLRDAQKKGQLTARVWVLAIGFLFVVYGIGLPVSLLYIKNPAYKSLFVAAIVLVAISFGVVVWLGLKWHFEGAKAADSKKETSARPD